MMWSPMPKNADKLRAVNVVAAWNIRMERRLPAPAGRGRLFVQAPPADLAAYTVDVGGEARRKFEWGYLTMCCCHGQNRNCCCCCCGNGSNTGNGGITTLPSFPELPVFPGGGTAANTRWPVYVSFPAFLWDTAGGEDEDSSCGCGCCRG